MKEDKRCVGIVDHSLALVMAVVGLSICGYTGTQREQIPGRMHIARSFLNHLHSLLRHCIFLLLLCFSPSPLLRYLLSSRSFLYFLFVRWFHYNFFVTLFTLHTEFVVTAIVVL